MKYYIWNSVICQNFKLERFAKIVNGFQLLIIYVKRDISDVWQGSEYASVDHFCNL